MTMMEDAFTLFFALGILAYAEIHFRFPFIPSRLYRKEPEILFDLPFRAHYQEAVPLFLFVKDSHQFPVTLIEMTIEIFDSEDRIISQVKEKLNLEIHQNFYSRVAQLHPDHFPHPETYRILASLTYVNSHQKRKTIQQDNYRHLPHPPFEIHISESPLPALTGWYWGDMHVHSYYTRDQVEFAAPPDETAMAARAAGLAFMAITDHSFDLDDLPEDFLKIDPNLKKWDDFKSEVSEVQSRQNGFLILPGEEVSIGNHKKKNIHCLILNDQRFFPGSGDSGEKLWNNRPTLLVNELLSQKSETALAIAAHPLEKPPLSQQIILNRGIWEESDFQWEKLNALQIMNNHAESNLQEGINIWKKLLLQGKKIGIVAGTDSHGNFNCFRQISVPFLSMVYSREHMLGRARTAVMMTEFSIAGLTAGIRQLKCIISNGPFAIMQLQSDETVTLGDSGSFRQQDARIILTGKSTTEFGAWKTVYLYYGDYNEKLENKVEIALEGNPLEFKIKLKVHYPAADYVRLEAFSKKNDQRYTCLTNPIWNTTT